MSSSVHPLWLQGKDESAPSIKNHPLWDAAKDIESNAPVVSPIAATPVKYGPGHRLMDDPDYAMGATGGESPIIDRHTGEAISSPAEQAGVAGLSMVPVSIGEALASGTMAGFLTKAVTGAAAGTMASKGAKYLGAPEWASDLAGIATGLGVAHGGGKISSLLRSIPENVDSPFKLIKWLSTKDSPEAVALAKKLDTQKWLSNYPGNSDLPEGEYTATPVGTDLGTKPSIEQYGAVPDRRPPVEVGGGHITFSPATPEPEPAPKSELSGKSGPSARFVPGQYDAPRPVASVVVNRPSASQNKPITLKELMAPPAPKADDTPIERFYSQQEGESPKDSAVRGNRTVWARQMARELHAYGITADDLPHRGGSLSVADLDRLSQEVGVTPASERSPDTLTKLVQELNQRWKDKPNKIGLQNLMGYGENK